MRNINAYADARGTRHIEWGELVTAYPSLADKAEPAQGVTPLTTSVHCECTVAIHMFQKISEKVDWRTPRSVDIGVSKHSCWFCQKYLEFVLQSFWRTKFVVTAYQGKIQAGWIPPEHGPTSALNNVAMLLNHEMDEILECVEQKRRSDSFPIESHPHDAERTGFGFLRTGETFRLEP